MESTRFDRITSSLAETRTRRSALGVLAAAFGAGGLSLLGGSAVAAKKRGKKKGGKKGTGSGSTGGGTPAPSGGTGGTTIPQNQCPVAAKTNAPVCGSDPGPDGGPCDCHRAVEGNNFCGGFITSCAGLRSCTSTQDCRNTVGFHYVCQAVDGGACGQVCVPACENRYPYP